MEYTYNTEKTCARTIKFTLNGNIVTNVRFLNGGCHGNLQALPKLIEGMEVEEIIKRLEGINCNGKGTSCADQLVQAIKTVYKK